MECLTLRRLASLVFCFRLSSLYESMLISPYNNSSRFSNSCMCEQRRQCQRAANKFLKIWVKRVAPLRTKGNPFCNNIDEYKVRFLSSNYAPSIYPSYRPSQSPESVPLKKPFCTGPLIHKIVT
jgi:hypothetical protein